MQLSGLQVQGLQAHHLNIRLLQVSLIEGTLYCHFDCTKANHVFSRVFGLSRVLAEVSSHAHNHCR
jgi:hypothetical protein